MILIHYQRKMFISKLTNLSLRHNEMAELVKKNVNEYSVIIIKIHDKNESISLKELFIKEGIDAKVITSIIKLLGQLITFQNEKVRFL